MPRSAPWLRVLLLSIVFVGIAIMTAPASPAYATTFTVTKTADTADGSCTPVDCSLREAIIAANAAGGDDIISLPAGIYSITLGPGPDENASAAGDFDITGGITITGAGAASTIIDGGNADRIFDIAPLSVCNCTVTISGVTLRNGKGHSTNFNVGGALFINNGTVVNISDSVISSNSSVASSGGAIENRGTLSLTDVTFQNNTALGLGGAINNTGALTVTNSTFTNNNAESGGALYLNTASGKAVSITNSTFNSNHAVATAGGVSDNGGAVAIDTDGTVSISRSQFTGNTAAVNGGAIYYKDSATEMTIGTLNVSLSRFAGNTASGQGEGVFGENDTPVLEKNWWGCNAGPSNAACDSVQGTGDFTPWMLLGFSAATTSLSAGQMTTLTADFSRNSDTSTNTATDLAGLAGTPVSFGGASNGSISGAQATFQSNGTATATFTAGSTSGPASANVTVDGQTLTANMTVTRPSTTVSPITLAGTSPTNAGSVSWTVTFGTAVSGLGTGNFQINNSGLTGSVAVTSVTPNGGAPATVWTVTASTGSGQGTLGITLQNDTGVSHAFSTPVTAPTYSVDHVAPTVAITSAAPNPTNASPIPVTVTFSEPVTGFITGDITPGNATVANFVGSGTTYTFDLMPSGQGPVTANIAQGVAQDAVGNGNSAAIQFSRTFDSVAPTVQSIVRAGTSPTNATSVQFTVRFSESVTGVDLMDFALDTTGVSGASVSNVSGSGDTRTVTVNTGSGDGTIRLDLVDDDTIVDAAQNLLGGTGAGNGSFTTGETYTIDKTRPSVTVEQAAGQADPTYNNRFRFTVIFSEPVTGFNSLDDIAITRTATLSSLGFFEIAPNDGTTYQLEFRVSSAGMVTVVVVEGATQDAAGNTNTASTSNDNTITFLVDATPPDTAIDSGPPSVSNSTSATFTFSGSDTGGSGVTGLECSLDGAAFAACTSPQNHTNLSEGSHTFQVRAKDAAGNLDPSPASFTWVVDTTPPTTNISSAPPTLTNSTNAMFSFSGTDAGGVTSFECKLDGGGFSACTPPQTYTGLSEESHTFQVRAIDAAGNVDATPASFTWTIDTTPPDTSIGDKPAVTTNSATATFTFSATEPGSTFACKLDGGAFTACTSPQTYTGLSDGSHTFQVRATDVAGNVDLSPASVTWTIDTVSPDTTLVTTPGAYSSATATFTFTGSDPGGSVAGFECKLDGGAFTACTSPHPVTGLSEGSHTFQVRARDTAANVDPTPASHTWLVDVTPPTTSATTNPSVAGGWAGGPVTVTLSATDQPGLSGVQRTEYQVDGGPWTAYTAPFTVSGNGAHTVQYRSLDKAGNQELDRTLAFTIDTVAPELWYEFDPATRGVRVFGRDEVGGSGLASSGPVTPVTCATQRTGQQCLYRVADRAGNSTTWSLLITKTNTQTRVRVMSLQSSGQPATTPLTNETVVDFAPASGNLSSLSQCASVTTPPSGGQPAAGRKVCAQWTGGDTTLQFVTPSAPNQTRTGMALLRVLSARGALTIETP